jgi:hypothetical protein
MQFFRTNTIKIKRGIFPKPFSVKYFATSCTVRQYIPHFRNIDGYQVTLLWYYLRIIITISVKDHVILCDTGAEN